MVDVFVIFFFSSRRRHTIFKCDWSSDVCSSDLSRRAFLAAVGMGTTLAAISEVFSIAKAAELALSTPGAIEKKQLKIGFIPITCATPIIMAEPLGFYRKHGLDAEVITTAGWAVIRDKALNK